jgi:hypothetical protein
MPALVSVSAAQQATGTSQNDRYEKKTFVEQYGTQTLTRTLETEHHVTSDGEVEIQRYRAPAWDGDNRVTWERETRTRTLPDGTVEKEYVLRNTDGSGQLAPIQVIREKTASAADSTVTQREILQRAGGPDLQPVQKEQITQKGPNNAKQVVREIQRLDSTSHWQTIEREKSSTSTIGVGEKTETETKSIRETPNAYGELSDYERRQERSLSGGGKKTNERTVYRRDNSTSDPDRFFLSDHTTTEVTATAPGQTTRRIVRESERNMYSDHPEVVAERVTEEKLAHDGSRQTVTKVSERSPADPSVLTPLYTVTEYSDAAGYVRQIYIPAQQQAVDESKGEE